MIPEILAFTNVFLIGLTILYMPKKGITSVIATLLLICIAVAVCGLAGVLSWNLIRDSTKYIMEKIGGAF